jgi:hypothetical protein
MSHHLGRLLAVGALFLFTATWVQAQEEKVANPYYKFWAGTKAGTTVVHTERTKLSGPEGKVVPDGVDEKFVTYKLVSVTDDRAVVEMVVTEEDFLGYIQAAPTRYIYPAKLPKARLDRVFAGIDKKGEETLTVAGKEIKCRTVSGSVKEPNGEVVDYKLWLSDTVPGSIVKQVRTARQKNNLIAETTITLKSYKDAK